MSNVWRRVVAKVRALLPDDWQGQPGTRFRKVVDIFSATVTETLPSGNDIPGLVSEGTKRYAIGKVSKDHADAVKAYAEEEQARIDIEFKKRTLEDRVRQEYERAHQAEIQTRTMRTQELMAALELWERLREMNLMPMRDADGNMTFVKVSSAAAWERARQRLLQGEDLAVLAEETVKASDGN